MSTLSIVIPCYFNEGNIPVTTAMLVENEKQFPPGTQFEYVMVDDGSGDNTLPELLKFRQAHPKKVKIIKLTRNFGSYQAILAGLTHATGDCTCIITADLQDPPELMPQLYEHWLRGYQLVIGCRESREDKSTFADLFHATMRQMFFPTAPPGGFDYVLFSRELREKALNRPEARYNIFYTLLRLSPHYQRVLYVRRQRQIGRSRWTLRKKVKLLFRSITAFAFPAFLPPASLPAYSIERVYE